MTVSESNSGMLSDALCDISIQKIATQTFSQPDTEPTNSQNGHRYILEILFPDSDNGHTDC